MSLEYSPRELAVLHLLVGHGWRQNKVLEIKDKDVRSISGDMILCHGKHREEHTAVLPETADLLVGLDDDEQVIRGKRGREERFGSTGMANLKSMFARAGLTRFAGHNFRDTFTTLVDSDCGDLTVAMGLIRDRLPGTAARVLGIVRLSPVSTGLRINTPAIEPGRFRVSGEAWRLRGVSNSPSNLTRSLLSRLCVAACESPKKQE